MNKREYQIKKKELMSKIKKHNGINCVKYWKLTKREHFITIAEIVYFLCNNGYTCYTEVEFSKGRADIFAISPEAEGIVIEVLHTETEHKFSAKLNKYPFRIIKIETKNFVVGKLKIDTFK